MSKLNAATGRAITSALKRNRLIEMLAEEAEAAIPVVEALMDEVCAGSTKLVSSLTCQYYDGIRSASGVAGEFRAKLWNGYSASYIMQSSQAAISNVLSGRATVPLANLLVDIAYGENKRSATSTLRANGRNDPAKPRFAVVPSPGACAWCVMQAGRGLTSAKEFTVEFHNHCTCEVVPVFGDARIQGYDPRVYERYYTDAKAAYENGDISQDLAYRIEIARAEHDAAYKAALAANESAVPWSETNAVLMVMRDQQGIK